MLATILIDNIACGELKGEWGLSIYIEYNGKNILLLILEHLIYLQRMLRNLKNQ